MLPCPGSLGFIGTQFCSRDHEEGHLHSPRRLFILSCSDLRYRVTGKGVTSVIVPSQAVPGIRKKGYRQIAELLPAVTSDAVENGIAPAGPPVPVKYEGSAEEAVKKGAPSLFCVGRLNRGCSPGHQFSHE